MTLTKKIVAPFVLLGVLVAIMLAVTWSFDARKEANANEERALLKVLSDVHEVANHVKTGILTRKDVSAIDTAKTALDVDARLAKLSVGSADMRKRFEDYYAAVVAINSIYLENRITDGEKRLDQLKEQVYRINGDIQARINEVDAERSRLTTIGRAAQITVLLAMIVTILIVAGLVSRRLVRPIRDLQNIIATVSETGRLDLRVEIFENDEIGQMANSFNQLMGTMQTALRNILNSVDQVSDATRMLSTSSSQVAASSVQQSNAASAMATKVEQVTASIHHVSGSARDALTISRKSGELSSQGGAIIHNTAMEIMQIADTVRATSSTIEELGQQSNQISSVVQVIKDVADQTNLLALNAAIEAARAGEQGRGFAVVADEVRKLAERTTKATEEITQMIGTIQGSARAAVGSMDNTVNQVGGGVQLAQQAEEAINQIKDGAGQVIGVVNDISSALMQQSNASNDIATQVEKVARMSEENSAAAGETANAANRLEQLANDMRETVSKFRI